MKHINFVSPFLSSSVGDNLLCLAFLAFCNNIYMMGRQLYISLQNSSLSAYCRNCKVLRLKNNRCHHLSSSRLDSYHEGCLFGKLTIPTLVSSVKLLPKRCVVLLDIDQVDIFYFREKRSPPVRHFQRDHTYSVFSNCIVIEKHFTS